MFNSFLMYRVELKARQEEVAEISKSLFLMYRVELKGFFGGGLGGMF